VRFGVHFSVARHLQWFALLRGSRLELHPNSHGRIREGKPDPFLGLVVGRYQPLADGGAKRAAPPDHACLLQSHQKAKRSGLADNPLVFAFAKNPLG
jgi:hypothetical protein